MKTSLLIQMSLSMTEFGESGTIFLLKRNILLVDWHRGFVSIQAKGGTIMALMIPH